MDFSRIQFFGKRTLEVDIYLDKLCVTWHGQIFLAKKTKRIELVPFILQFPPIIFAFRPIIFIIFVKTLISIGLTVVKHAKPSERNHKKKGPMKKPKLCRVVA